MESLARLAVSDFGAWALAIRRMTGIPEIPTNHASDSPLKIQALRRGCMMVHNILDCLAPMIHGCYSHYLYAWVHSP